MTVEAPAATRPPATGRLAPMPPGPPLVGHVGAMRTDPFNAMLGWRERHGDVVRLRMGPFVAHMLFHPDHVRHVLQEQHRNYNKQTRGFNAIRVFLGNGLLTSEGAFWLRQRRIAQPAFHRQRVAALGAAMTRATEAMLDRWQPLVGRGASIDVAGEMMHLTLRIVAESLFGADVGARAAEVGPALTVVQHEMDHRINALVQLPLKYPTPHNVRLRRAAAVMDDIVGGIIRARRGASARPDDLLSMLMESRDEETGEAMSDAQLRDEVMTLFVAGHETTSNALTWTFYLLSRHPAVAQTLRAELREVLGGRTPTVADLPKLPYTRMVLQESMRVFPPAWVVGRSPVADDVIGGYDIPRGTLVFVSPWVTHRHPAFWDNPEGFDPERFRAESGAGRPAFAYFPFGGGPRLCIGNTFALTEAQLVLATVAQRVRLDLVPGHRVEPEPLITLRPRYGVRVTLHPA